MYARETKQTLADAADKRDKADMTTPQFTLFKSTSKANRAEYIGHVLLPDGRLYAIEANVSEHDRGDGTKGKHFEGSVFSGQELVRTMLRGARVDGTLPPDLVTLMEGMPFDDPLPNFSPSAEPTK